jgi:ribosomal protein S18 acetylase RimI-like enzyme
MMKGTDITIRPGSLDDVEALVNLENRAFSTDRFNRRQYIYLLGKAKASVTIVETERGVAGAAVMLWRDNSKNGRLYNLAVDPGFQGLGLGTVLLDACEKEALRRNRAIVTLEVRPGNTRAIGFYQARGYEVVANLPEYYSDGGDGLRMRKILDRV